MTLNFGCAAYDLQMFTIKIMSQKHPNKIDVEANTYLPTVQLQQQNDMMVQ